VDLVEDDQAVGKALQVEPGACQLIALLAVLQVQIKRVALGTERPCECGLADLAGADQGDGRLTVEGRA